MVAEPELQSELGHPALGSAQMEKYTMAGASTPVPVFADDLSDLIQAATSDAQAAADAVSALREQQNARAAQGAGFQEASKVVRQPEAFGSENHDDDLAKWQEFHVNFKAWLFYGNSKFESDLHRAEQYGSAPLPMQLDLEPNDVQELQTVV